MKRSLKKHKLIILAVVTSSAIFTGCGNDGVYEKARKGFDILTEVPGISFAVPDGLTDYATAVSSISDSMNFEPSGTYVYKDLSGKYFLFCMDSIVVAAQKASGFGITEAEDITAAIEENNMFGIWFQRTGKKLSYKSQKDDSVYKIIADVDASVSVTRDLFNDYTGKLAIIDDGTQEWAMFCGILKDAYEEAEKDTLDGISHMAKSVTLNKEITVHPEEQLVIAESSETIETESEVGDGAESETETKQEAGSVSENSEPAEETIPGTEDIVISVTEEDTAMEEESSTEEESLQTETAALEETITDENKDKEGETSGKRKSISLDNQRQAKTKDDTAYSTVYSTLKPGDPGYADCYSKEVMGAKEVVVKLTAVYSGNEAASILSDKLDNGFVAASAGTTWHVVEYEITYPDEERPYLNVLFTGMDGNNLRHRGVRYSKKTGDISDGDKRYAYYQVPNGCKEYLIQFGDCPTPGAHSAFYKVHVED